MSLLPESLMQRTSAARPLVHSRSCLLKFMTTDECQTMFCVCLHSLKDTSLHIYLVLVICLDPGGSTVKQDTAHCLPRADILEWETNNKLKSTPGNRGSMEKNKQEQRWEWGPV
jgi:hypothetical protein